MAEGIGGGAGRRENADVGFGMVYLRVGFGRGKEGRGGIDKKENG